MQLMLMQWRIYMFCQDEHCLETHRLPRVSFALLPEELFSIGTIELKMSLAEAPLRAHKGHRCHWLQRNLLIPNLPQSCLAITVTPEILIMNIHFSERVILE